MMSTPAQTVRLTSLPNGQKLTNVDRRGVVRGACIRCKDCEQFEVESGLCCDYCGCPPGKHSNMGYFNSQDIVNKTTIKPAAMAATLDPGVSSSRLPQQQHELCTSPVAIKKMRGMAASPLPARKETRTVSKGVSVSELMNLPGSMRLDDAMKYLTIEQSSSPPLEGSRPSHFSSPDISYGNYGTRSKTPLSQFSETSSTNVAALLQAIDSYDRAYDKSGSDLNVSKGSSKHILFDDRYREDDGEHNRSELTISHDTPATTNDEKTLTLPLSQSVGGTEQVLQIIAMNGGQVVRAHLKESVVLRVDIIPRHVTKQHVTWYHNNKKIAPRYRVRFVNDRREVHILSLRKKDSGVYMCQVKYNNGKSKQRESCTLLLEVVVPKFAPKEI